MTSRTRTDLAAVWPPTAAVAAAAGHEPKSPMKAIREKCVDCCAGQFSEIQRCESVACALWPFRAGKHIYTAAAMKKAAHGASFQESEASHGED